MHQVNASNRQITGSSSLATSGLPPPGEVPNILERFGGLPVFLPVVTHLLQVVDDPQATQAKVAGLIESDPGLAADTLRLANSPLFGFTATVQTIPHAVSLLGIERVRRMATTVTLRRYLSALFTNPPVRRLWAHSIACGVISAEIASRTWVSRDHGYAAGLLHDVGRIGMMSAYPEKVCGILSADYESIGDVLLSEREALGMDHCEAGWWLSKTWGLPESLWKTSRHHHTGPDGKTGLEAIVSFSCRLSDSLGFPAVSCAATESPQALLATTPSYRHVVLVEDLTDLAEKAKRALDSLG
jgi:HD-like signal output (HDOD) protein